jgi:N utilization substance protein B
MAARSKARKRALDILFEAEARRESPSALLESRTVQADPPVSSYAAELVRGVQAHRDQIDELLTEYSRGWSLDRMPAVDRNVLRIGAYELLWGIGVPAAVAINEAVLLAQSLSTDGSPAFVNGLLARLLAERPSIVGDVAGGPDDVASGPDDAAAADGDEDANEAGLADDDADADEPA